MLQVQAPGVLTGSSAQSLSDMSAGTWFRYVVAGSDYVCMKVTVAGQTPAAGKVFAMRLNDGVVCQLAGAGKPIDQCVGTYSFSPISWPAKKTGNEESRSTVGDVAAAEFFDTSPSPGNLSLKVVVLDGDGAIIAPAAGQSWTYDFTGSAVVQTADTVAVDGYGDARASAHILI